MATATVSPLQYLSVRHSGASCQSYWIEPLHRDLADTCVAQSNQDSDTRVHTQKTGRFFG